MPNFLASKWLLIILVILAVVSIVYFYRQVLMERKLKMEYEAIVRKIEDLKRENESLSDEMARLQNKEELERLAREIYVLKKPGESVMVISQEMMRQLKKDDVFVEQNQQSEWQKFVDNIKGFFKDLFK